jgi:hypothetical protein
MAMRLPLNIKVDGWLRIKKTHGWLSDMNQELRNRYYILHNDELEATSYRIIERRSIMQTFLAARSQLNAV